jgi:hypothetical protein
MALKIGMKEIQRMNIEVKEHTVTKTIIKADSQILNSIDLCGQRYEYEHILNRRPNDKAISLARGDAMHRMLAHYYKAKRDKIWSGREAITISECLEIGREACAELSLSVQEFETEDISTFKAYVLRYQYDGWEIQFVEEPFSTVLYDSDDLMIIWEGIVDLGVRDPKGEELVVDHKTEQRRSHPYPLSNQFEGYSFAFKRPIVINKVGFQTTLEDKERFRRYYYQYSQALIEEWRRDAINSFKRAIQWHKEGYFPRDRTSCDKYSGCIYQMVCKEEPEVREHKLRAYFFVDQVWDPYTRDPA